MNGRDPVQDSLGVLIGRRHGFPVQRILQFVPRLVLKNPLQTRPERPLCKSRRWVLVAP